MTFALPGVEEHEADSDGVCEQLSHLLQATGYVAALSKLTVCNALPPTCPPSCLLFYLPFLSSLCHPPFFFHASFFFFFGRVTVSTTSSLTHSTSYFLSQLLTFIFFPSLLQPPFLQCVCLREEQVGLAGGLQRILVGLMKVLGYSFIARTCKT